MPQYTIFTVGHGELSWQEFVLLLRPHAIEVLADVRSFPYCPATPWFNRDQLEHQARKAGWEYYWLGGQLGPLTAEGRVDFIAKEREVRYHDGIKELLTIAGERPVCLLSSQTDPLKSHRHQLIAQTLLRHDVGVQHILDSGVLAAASADLFHSQL